LTNWLDEELRGMEGELETEEKKLDGRDRRLQSTNKKLNGKKNKFKSGIISFGVRCLPVV
jgi:hypothetical protein